MPALRILLSLSFVFLASLACTDATTAVLHDRVDPNLLTPDVAARLNASGRFPEQMVEPGYINPRSRGDADSLARRYIRERSNNELRWWEETRGASIDVSRLRRCSPVWYARSVYEVAQFTESQFYRVFVGGQYQMLFCGADGRPALSAQVPVEPALTASGFAGDLQGTMVSPVPIEMEAVAFVGPEEAVRIAAGRTGRRVASVPELVSGRLGDPRPLWYIRLESPVQVFGSVTLAPHVVDLVAVGIHFSDTYTSVIPLALRPYDLATPEARLDTFVDMEGEPTEIFTMRLGTPRRFEGLWRMLSP